MNRLSTLFAIVFCLGCSTAMAQWQWVDKDGRKVFSDRAPPPDVPARSILKQPGTSARPLAVPIAQTEAPAKAASAAADSDMPVPKLQSEDKDLTERKKQADAALAAKEKAELQRIAKIKAENCERGRAAKALMDSGVRVSSTNAKGERQILDDAGRAVELKRAQSMIAAECQ